MNPKAIELLLEKFLAVSTRIAAEGTSSIKAAWVPFSGTFEAFMDAMASGDLPVNNKVDTTSVQVVEVKVPEKVVAPVVQKVTTPVVRKANLNASPKSRVTATAQPVIKKPVKAPRTNQAVNTLYGNKFRRIKNGVDKPKKKESNLNASQRDALNKFWNIRQCLIDKKDPVCADLAEQISKYGSFKVAAYQVSGWFSFLAGRLALLTEENREAWISRQMASGTYTVRPDFSKKFLDIIRVNYEKNREDERIRRAAHDAILAQRAIVKTESVPAKSATPAADIASVL